MLHVWWWLLHAVLASAVALTGLPAAFKWLGLAAVVAHGVLRRPARSPALVVLAEGGVCGIPEWCTGMRPLGPRTIVAPGWVRLDLRWGGRQREFLLMADQVGPDDWRLLRGVLARARGDGATRVTL